METRTLSRPQSNTRLDLIAQMLRGKNISFIGKIVEHPVPSLDAKDTTVVMQRLPAKGHGPSSPVVAASPMDPPKTAGMRSPRSLRSLHRPASIEVQQSNGCTAITTAELKQRICDSKNDTQTTVVQIPIDKRQPFPPTPTTPFYLTLTTMGNKPSSTTGTPDLKNRTPHAISRSAKSVSRKSSFNILKQRVDNRSPLRRDATASVMSMMQRDTHRKDASADHIHGEGDGDGVDVAAVARSVFNAPETTAQRLPRARHAHEMSTSTMTEARARRQLSTSTTVRDLRLHGPDSRKFDESFHDANDKHSRPSLRNAGLSPTLPVPSPLPEDSPHKYGLRDKMETPELPEKAMVISKARRKSSGLEIFNEAKSLQSAASFLNGLSTSRRRAESAADTSTSSWVALNAPSRPSSTMPSLRRPSSGTYEGEGRRNGHNFKSSGFAYSRPLNMSQLKCFRGHDRMLLSRNKHAPVECAVCHIDDDGEHFSCSWCALRMCKYCRRDFAQRGMSALRERIKTAELGSSGSSENSSSESLVGDRGRRLSSRSFPQLAC